MRHIAIDVGANNGKWGIQYAKDNPNVTVIAFEPVKHLAEKIWKDTKDLKNYVCFQKAVGAQVGTTTLKVSPNEASCSSILEFRTDEELKDVWVGRQDLKKVDEYEVEVCVLAAFVGDAETVDFLHVDAQGMDLEVLKGLGDRIHQVKMGEVEAIIDPKESIYLDQTSTVESCRDFLIQHGFKVAVLPHLNFLEADLRFWR
jgi:FkbM family methyltransferase